MAAKNSRRTRIHPVEVSRSTYAVGRTNPFRVPQFRKVLIAWTRSQATSGYQDHLQKRCALHLPFPMISRGAGAPGRAWSAILAYGERSQTEFISTYFNNVLDELSGNQSYKQQSRSITEKRVGRKLPVGFNGRLTSVVRFNLCPKEISGRLAEEAR